MKGAGEKSFCAGGDIVDVTKQAKQENYLAGLFCVLILINNILV